MEKKGLSLNLNKKPARIIASKRTMNFAFHQSNVNWKKLGIILGIVLVIVGLFVKFAIVDQLALKNDALNRLHAAEDRLAMVNARMAKYNELKAEYDRYSDARLNQNELYLISRVDVFDIIEEYILPEGSIRDFRVRDNTITLYISGLSLADAADLIVTLEELEQVTDVMVTSADSSDSDVASMNMTIEMQKGAE